MTVEGYHRVRRGAGPVEPKGTGRSRLSKSRASRDPKAFGHLPTDATVVVIRQRTQGGGAITRKGGTMHERQRARRELAEAADGRAHAGIEAGIPEQVFRGDRRPDSIAVGQCLPVPALGVQVAAQQGARGCLVDHGGIPAMRGGRRSDETDALAAPEVDNFAVLQYAWGTIREVVERYQATGLTVGGQRLRCDSEPFVHRPALVGLEMTERDKAQALRRNDSAEGVAIERKHFSQTGVEHQRLVPENEKLIEGETGGRRD